MTLKVGPRALALIREFEGCKLTAYQCPARVWTIGYGDTGPNIVRGLKWTQAQADEAFTARINREFAPAVAKTIGDALTTPAQFGAMVSLAYNIGTAAFARSSVAKHHKANSYIKAANAFAAWNRAGGKVLSGLTRRRAAEAKLYRGET